MNVGHYAFSTKPQVNNWCAGAHLLQREVPTVIKRSAAGIGRGRVEVVFSDQDPSIKSIPRSSKAPSSIAMSEKGQVHHPQRLVFAKGLGSNRRHGIMEMDLDQDLTAPEQLRGQSCNQSSLPAGSEVTRTKRLKHAVRVVLVISVGS